MSHLYENIEPTIIDDELVQKVLEEERTEGIEEIVRTEGFNLKDVKELQLSFRNILQIANLWQFENLTKLQLDNNIIEKIEGLESLVHLVWLDLSFNNIEVIEGLDTLIKLQDLSLYSNRISKIENLDTLQELQIFSIGKNNLTTLEDREEAVLQYQYHIEPLEQEEAEALAQLEDKQAKQRELEYHKTAFVEYLNGSFLFDSMFAEDTEAAKLACLPGVNDLLQTYREEFVSVCESLFNYGLKEHENREAEVSHFYEYLNEVLTANQQEGRKRVLEFENQSKKRLEEIHNATSYDIAESKRARYREDILQLSEALMGLEILITNQLEEILEEFKRNIAAVASTFMENVKGMMNQCRDLENHHHEKLMEISITTLEKSLKDELDVDLPAAVQRLLVDKNTIVNAVNTSHGTRLRSIDKRESDILSNIDHWQNSVTEKAFQNEIDRNRNRVKEIIVFIENLQEELESIKIPEPTE
ncbi:dynein regulatory complex subunit 3 isoform X2 [Melopsittacus undulatus]|uniref:Dynein regulatory complex subunit 3 n=1 Tax=Melopsittacus undulatus TaxID=13146 RepID=A0A8C6JD65_MELUD|nr:dynein regulatory complex subunit 3 isoform X2 [Melopsittacus undulatus]